MFVHTCCFLYVYNYMICIYVGIIDDTMYGSSNMIFVTRRIFMCGKLRLLLRNFAQYVDLGIRTFLIASLGAGTVGVIFIVGMIYVVGGQDAAHIGTMLSSVFRYDSLSNCQLCGIQRSLMVYTMTTSIYIIQSYRIFMVVSGSTRKSSFLPFIPPKEIPIAIALYVKQLARTTDTTSTTSRFAAQRSCTTMLLQLAALRHSEAVLLCYYN